eukprot:jgi/Chrzof1/9382/Cz04g00220.t1
MDPCKTHAHCEIDAISVEGGHVMCDCEVCPTCMGHATAHLTLQQNAKGEKRVVGQVVSGCSCYGPVEEPWSVEDYALG